MATIKRVGVIGAGQMGSGIAHVCALAGYDVLINDLDSQRIDDGLARAEQRELAGRPGGFGTGQDHRQPGAPDCHPRTMR